MGSGLYLLGLWFSQFYSLRSDSWFKLSKLSVHFSADFFAAHGEFAYAQAVPSLLPYLRRQMESGEAFISMLTFAVSKWSVVLGRRWRLPACQMKNSITFLPVHFLNSETTRGKTLHNFVSLFPSTPHNSCEQIRLQGDTKIYIHFTL